MAKPAALVLSSGGLHSLITAALAAREYRVALLHVNDGRITSKQAALAFDKQVLHFKPIRSWTVEAAFIRQMSLAAETAGGGGGGAGGGLVHSTCSDPQAVLVPTRDLQYLSLAVGFAKQVHAPVIFWGAHFEQKQTDALARNIELVQIFNQYLDVMSPDPAAHPLVLKTPLMGLDDQQVLELGYQMGVPFAATWTCQMALDYPCMSCPACARRIRGFRAAQLSDPLVPKAKSVA